MLKYTVKPSKETELRDFPIRDFYVAPNLLYITGVTDYNVGLVDGEQVVIKSPYLIGSEVNTVNVVDVRRQGKLGIVITLPVKKITKYLKFDIYNDNDGQGNYILAYNSKQYIGNVTGDTVYSSVTQNYVEYKGDICYFFRGNVNGYLVDHKFYNASVNDDTIDIETFAYIDDGEIHIGDAVYFADFTNVTNEGDVKPEIRLSKYVEPISGGDFLGYVGGNTCSAMSDSDESLVIRSYKPKDWERVSKFYIIKDSNPTIYPEDVLYGGFNHYVTYRDENYYLHNVDIDDENKGYGVIIDEKFYEVTNNYGFETEYHDNQYVGSSVYIAETDEYISVEDTLVSFADGGWLVLLIDIEMNSDIQHGNYIIAESNTPISIRCGVIMDEHPYIEYLGEKYYVQDHLCDTITMSDKEYRLVYLNDDFSSAGTIINGEVVYFTIKDNKATLDANIYYQDESSTDTIKVKYGINEDAYDVTNVSGVTINGVRYPVEIDVSSGLTDEDNGVIVREEYGVTVNDYVKIPLYVLDINGSSTYVCYPAVDDELFDEVEAYSIMRELTSIIVDNWKVFSFTVRKDTFGNKEFTVENGLMASMSAEKPYTMSDAYLLENRIDILRLHNYLSLKFPMSNKSANNIMREDTVKNDFVDYVRKEATNRIVDMEKDVYYPVWRNNVSGNTYYRPIEQIRFNLHFRTRNLDNWKIIEDDREYAASATSNSVMSNWFVTDYKYYQELVAQERSDSQASGYTKYLHNSSDPLGFLNFSTDEIRNQASKVAKSFLRLSFYSTNNPRTQVLLGTSTIFFDENYAYKRYIDSKRNSYLVYVDTKTLEESIYNSATEYFLSADTSDYQVTSRTISNFSEVWDVENGHGDYYLNDGTRLSSRFIVENKYNTDTSSEGYYFYMFKEYSRKMREATVYLKVEFNHAGIGKTIPFMLPRKNDNTPLYVHNVEDLNTLKNGFRMVDMYNQVYIPIRLIYDDKENRYVYFLPDELRENDELGVPNEVMEFNLFEVKFANEAMVGDETTQTSVTYTSVIDGDMCVNGDIYERVLKKASYDGGNTWTIIRIGKGNVLTPSGCSTGDYNAPPISSVDDDSQKLTISSGTPYCGGSTGCDRYVNVYEQVSGDGNTLITVSSRQVLVEANSEECPCGDDSSEITVTRFQWVPVNGESVCINGYLYQKIKEQSSTDGVNWTDTGEYGTDAYLGTCGGGSGSGTGGGEGTGTGGGGNSGTGNEPTYEGTKAYIVYDTYSNTQTVNCNGNSTLTIEDITGGDNNKFINFVQWASYVNVGYGYGETPNRNSCVYKVGDRLFYGCNHIRNVCGFNDSYESSVKLGPNVRIIGEYAFSFGGENDMIYGSNGAYYDGPYLENIVLPDSIQTIEKGAFDGCKSHNVRLGYNTTEIGEYAFKDAEIRSIGPAGSGAELELPGIHGFEEIGEHVFVGCTALTSVTLPNSVKYIRKGAFSGCTSLTAMTASNWPQINSILDDAFSDCTALTSVEFPSTIRYIDGFSGCTSLTDVIIPSDVYSLSLTSYAFANCTSLTDFVVPSNIRLYGIANYAFKDCTSLTNFSFPGTITGLYEGVFQGCINLASITINSETPPLIRDCRITDVFPSGFGSSNCVIYVPSSAVETYRNDENWRTYADKIQAIQ